MEKEIDRLETFNQWCNPHVKREDLARVGFIHLQSDNIKDKVKCVFCGLVLYNWIEGDVPVQEHYKHSRNCSLLGGAALNNQPIDVNKLKNELPTITIDECGFMKFADSNYCYNPEYIDLHQRLISFETWPPSMEQKPQELAEAGFFYTGFSDKVICFYCNIGLKEWEREDTPFEEHIKHSSKCQFLYLVKGSQYINEIIKKLSEENQISQSGHENHQIESYNVKSETTNANNLMNCICCLNKLSDVMFEKCHHCVTCRECSIKLNDCPMCRQPISKKVKIYFP